MERELATPFVAERPEEGAAVGVRHDQTDSITQRRLREGHDEVVFLRRLVGDLDARDAAEVVTMQRVLDDQPAAKNHVLRLIDQPDEIDGRLAGYSAWRLRLSERIRDRCTWRESRQRVLEDHRHGQG